MELVQYKIENLSAERTEITEHTDMRKILALLLILIGLATATFAVYLSLQFRDSKPILLAKPTEAKNTVVTMMDAVCRGDYETASSCMGGTPSLGVDRVAGSDVGILIWNAFQDSLSYELVGDCYSTDQGLAQDLTITCLDMSSVTARLRERSQSLLEARVAGAADVEEVYDENNEYREDIVMEVLLEAAKSALAEDAKEMHVTLTVGLRYWDNQWWVVADEALLDALSGGVLY